MGKVINFIHRVYNVLAYGGTALLWVFIVIVGSNEGFEPLMFGVMIGAVAIAGIGKMLLTYLIGEENGKTS